MTKFFKVKSFTEKDRTYTVRVFDTGEIRCECPGFVFNGKCKHVRKIAQQIISNRNKAS